MRDDNMNFLNNDFQQIDFFNASCILKTYTSHSRRKGGHNVDKTHSKLCRNAGFG